MSYAMTIKTILDLYLYGAPKPANPEARVRDGDTAETLATTVDVASYMATYGRFASPLQVEIVRRFLSGELSATGAEPDENGWSYYSIQDIMSQNGLSDDSLYFRVINYFAGVGDSDWAERAFIIGQAGFVLSPFTTFATINGERYVFSAAMLPQNDNFDFESSIGAIQAINERLEPYIDPYSIGKKLELNFDEGDRQDYAISQAGSQYSQADLPSVADYIVAGAAKLTNLASNITDVALEILELLTTLLTNTDYRYAGKNLVFGNNDVNVIDGSYVTDEMISDGIFDPALASFIVASGGDDRVTTSALPGSVVAAGSGNDLVNASASAEAVVRGGAGNDVVWLGRKGDGSGGDGDDTIILTAEGKANGGAGDDRIFVTSGGTHILSGGAGADDFVLLRAAQGSDQGEISIDTGAGADRIFIQADGSFVFGIASRTVTVKDAAADDTLVFNGFELTGGAYTVFDELRGHETFTGTAAYLDAHGVVYDLDYTGTLRILLPDMTFVLVDDWQQGDLGITLTGFVDLKGDRERITLEDNGWLDLPRTAGASFVRDFPFGAQFDEITHQNLGSAYSTYQGQGTLLAPEMPTLFQAEAW